MDPNATLDMLRQAIRDYEGGESPESVAGDLAEAAAALDTWITRGGFLPADWSN